MKAVWNGQVVAESDDTVVVEGNHYFPRAVLRRDAITPSDTTTFCPWKGTAHYYHLVVGGETNIDAVWYYPGPKGLHATSMAAWPSGTVSRSWLEATTSGAVGQRTNRTGGMSWHLNSAS